MSIVNCRLNLGLSAQMQERKTDLIDLEVNSSLKLTFSICYVVLGYPRGIAIEPGSTISIDVGYVNNLISVFTGIVYKVEEKLDRFIVIANGDSKALTTAYFNLIYEHNSAGDIVKNIAHNHLNLKIANIENGLTFPTYTIGDQQSVYDHLTHLAHQCNFDLYTNTEDELIFAKYNPTTTHTLTYGQNILRYQQTQPKPNITAIEIYGESPASQGQGEQASSWLTKKEVKGSAGSGTGTKLRVADPTVRTQATANKIAQAMLAQKQQKQRGQVRVLGDPSIKLGDAIKIENMPQATQNGTFKITAVAHHLSRQKGFYTTIDWEET